ncbi:hypothetical protein [Amycolatopsis sp. H20-H5]|uniref:hypothetical protein n=1 Tax=Amycolatopsis sp. H20-H5 TaxID=3046309 RepID=UPI002DB6414A|nr:hypothetical protein [Amycolatopsis sp. H20-H5]MEC3977180.1 hypothetical protein [Amycolatopsis sp. H20-H5]
MTRQTPPSPPQQVRPRRGDDTAAHLAGPAHPSGWDGTPIDHDGLLWKPEPGTTVTFAQFLQARATVCEIVTDTWNPWQRAEREDELRAANLVFEQWHRAEPGFRMWTADDLPALREETRTRLDQEHRRDEQNRLARIPSYDPERHQTRLALLEQQSRLRSVISHLDGLRDRSWTPLMDPAQRADEITRCQTRLAELDERVDQLAQTVGDPETVIDSHGRLPSDHRELNLDGFRHWRHQGITRLRDLITGLRIRHDASTDRAQRSELRGTIAYEQQELTALEAISEPDVADMCSECEKPSSWHEGPYTLVLPTGPCHQWPEEAEHRRETREWLKEFRKRPAAPKQPKPQPIAVIPSGLPLDQILTRLAELHTAHPDAIVRRGNANKWELWPPASPTNPPPPAAAST